MNIFETQSVILIAFVALFAVLGSYFTMVVPLMDDSLNTPSEGATDYTELQLKGKRIYESEGCTYCHTQQIRNLLTETKRYGMGEEETFKRFGVRTLIQAPPSQPGEYVYDMPHLLGTRRIGPDLARVGGKYDNSWHINHLRDPRSTSPGSIMPAYSWLFEKNGQPTQDAIALTAYMQKLGTNINWREEGVKQYKAMLPPEPQSEMTADQDSSKSAGNLDEKEVSE